MGYGGYTSETHKTVEQERETAETEKREEETEERGSDVEEDKGGGVHGGRSHIS